MEVVITFIEGTGSPECMAIVNQLKRVTKIRTNMELQIRYENLKDEENPFIDMIPKIMTDPQKLHSLFNAGWQHWVDPLSPIRKKYPNSADCSRAINNLIRDSIKLTMQQDETRRLRKAGNYLINIAAKYGLTGS